MVRKNQLAIGLGEMALGASLISWGVHNGVIEMGKELSATKIYSTNIESIIGTGAKHSR